MFYRRAGWVVGMAVIAAGVAVSRGQDTQPAPGGNGPVPQQQQQQQQPAAGGMGNGGGYVSTAYPEQYNYNNLFYPAPEVRALPNLRANAVAARANFRRAESDLNRAVEDIRRQFKNSSELNEALRDEREAYHELQRVQADATVRLREDANYQAAVALRRRLAEQIDVERREALAAGNKPNVEQVLAMATVKLSYSATASAMEAAALAADPRVKDSRRRLMDAAARVSELRRQFDEAVRNSPEVLLARKTLADSRIVALAAEAAYTEAAHVANVAFDYAYYLRNHPYPYVINNPYYYDYGGGYGYASWWRGGGHGSAYAHAGNPGFRVGYPYNWQRPRPTPNTPGQPRAGK